MVWKMIENLEKRNTTNRDLADGLKFADEYRDFFEHIQLQINEDIASRQEQHNDFYDSTTTTDDAYSSDRSDGSSSSSRGPPPHDATESDAGGNRRQTNGSIRSTHENATVAGNLGAVPGQNPDSVPNQTNMTTNTSMADPPTNSQHTTTTANTATTTSTVNTPIAGPTTNTTSMNTARFCSDIRHEKERTFRFHSAYLEQMRKKLKERFDSRDDFLGTFGLREVVGPQITNEFTAKIVITGPAEKVNRAVQLLGNLLMAIYHTVISGHVYRNLSCPELRDATVYEWERRISLQKYANTTGSERYRFKLVPRVGRFRKPAISRPVPPEEHDYVFTEVEPRNDNVPVETDEYRTDPDDTRSVAGTENASEPGTTPQDAPKAEAGQEGPRPGSDDLEDELQQSTVKSSPKNQLFDGVRASNPPTQRDGGHDLEIGYLVLDTSRIAAEQILNLISGIQDELRYRLTSTEPPSTPDAIELGIVRIDVTKIGTDELWKTSADANAILAGKFGDK